jgi:hypothetical protein
VLSDRKHRYQLPFGKVRYGSWLLIQSQTEITSSATPHRMMLVQPVKIVNSVGRMSAIGTNWTNRARPIMPVDWGRPEEAGPRPK